MRFMKEQLQSVHKNEFSKNKSSEFVDGSFAVGIDALKKLSRDFRMLRQQTRPKMAINLDQG